MVLDASPPPALLEVPARIDEVLREALAARRAELAAIDPAATEPIDEVIRLIEAGGKRIRPCCCYWGFRAAGGADGPAILHAASALELLHTMALIHDDVMDGATERRGVPPVHVRQAERAAARNAADPAGAGVALAIVAGDLAAVLADGLFLGSGFAPERLTAALARYHRMRLEMAAGQVLDLAGASGDPLRLAQLKGGAYTVGWPIAIGVALADGDGGVEEALERFATPLGQAFQLADDLRDGDAAPGIDPGDVAALVTRARAELREAPIDPTAASALDALAAAIA
ncbi:MAG TPA: polyprenyl synthetase family protein [Actinomycetota bacterium]|nr:polyprenyl synthetase family protein [Actinomycetota bacterium]